eukprot:TRINITY_DN51202_c0_g1_i1.p1 TRINITY_DN51202_c0_g1~~TRINITY_DN51202_c0_g1_i1.p1  ORF type:complete len:292 (-),score=33.98 TRINITY_DN51202_c0_g1_i1:34-828(-)
MAANEELTEWPFNAQFFLISAPPASGKTTFLQHCAGALRARGKSVAGVLAPSGEDGRRRLVILSSSGAREGDTAGGTEDAQLCLQLNDGKPRPTCECGAGSGEDAQQSTAAADSAQEGTIRIGNFIFDDNVFAAARTELLDHKRRQGSGVDWMILDEIGPLELKRGGGLEPAVGELLRAGARGELGPPQVRFLIVVRPSLRDELVKAYELDSGGGRQVDTSEGLFPGFGGPESLAAAVVDVKVPETREESESVCHRLANLPPLL